MTISRQNISIIIVTFKSEKVIHQCIKSIPKDFKIIIVDNSSDKNFKEKIEKIYQNVRCILSPDNLGMGAGNNLGLKNIKTDFAFVINPDVILESDTIDEIIHASNKTVLSSKSEICASLAPTVAPIVNWAMITTSLIL